MKELLTNPITLYTAGFVGIAGLAYLVHRFKKARLLAYALVMYAEDILGSGEGEKKKELVIEKLYQMLPSKISWLISKKRIERWIDKGLDQLEDYLDDGQLNDSNKTIVQRANEELMKVKLKDNGIKFKINGKF